MRPWRQRDPADKATTMFIVPIKIVPSAACLLETYQIFYGL